MVLPANRRRKVVAGRNRVAGQRRLGIRQAGWRALRRKGLPCYQVGKRVLIFGQDFFEFVRKQSQPE